MMALFPCGSRADVKGHPSSRLLAASERGTAKFILGDGTPSPKVFQCGAEVQYVVKSGIFLTQGPRAENVNYQTIHRTTRWSIPISKDSKLPFGPIIDSFLTLLQSQNTTVALLMELHFRDGLHTTKGGDPL